MKKISKKDKNYLHIYFFREISIKANGKMENVLEKEKYFIKMEVFMKGNGLMINLMVKED